MARRFVLVVVLSMLLGTLVGCSGVGVRLSSGNTVWASNMPVDWRRQAEQQLRWERKRTRALEEAARAVEKVDDIRARQIPLEHCRQAVATCVIRRCPDATTQRLIEHCRTLR